MGCLKCQVGVPFGEYKSCEPCLIADRERLREYRATRTPEQRARIAARSREVYAKSKAEGKIGRSTDRSVRNKAEGRCVTCHRKGQLFEAGRSVCTPCRDYHKEWRRSPEGLASNAKRCKKWRTSNPERTKEFGKRYNQEAKQRAIVMYGNHCACCNETRLGFLTIDHMNNDGRSDRKSVGSGNGGTRFYRKIVNMPKRNDLQVLCFNCNCGRQVNGGTCPHLDESSTTEVTP